MSGFPRLAVFVGLVPAVPEGNIHEALQEAEREQILATLQKSKLGRGSSGRRCRASWPEATTLQSRMQKLGIRVTRSA